jgi:hypothetical protein
MYVFGVVVTDGDETPTVRASEALRAELPTLFSEHRFEFLNPSELPQIERQRRARCCFMCSLRRSALATKSWTSPSCPRPSCSRQSKTR